MIWMQIGIKIGGQLCSRTLQSLSSGKSLYSIGHYQLRYWNEIGNYCWGWRCWSLNDAQPSSLCLDEGWRCGKWQALEHMVSIGGVHSSSTEWTLMSTSEFLCCTSKHMPHLCYTYVAFMLSLLLFLFC